MSDVLLLIRHGLFFALAPAPALLFLGALTRLLARRRNLEYRAWRLGTALLFILMAACCGIVGQALFVGLTLHGVSSHNARLIGMAVAAMGLGAIAPTVVPYFVRWKGICLGALSALPATWGYAAWLHVAGEPAARIGVATVIVAILTLAVTMPLPQTEELQRGEGVNDRFLPQLGRVGINARIRPKHDTIVPTRIVLITGTNRRKRL